MEGLISVPINLPFTRFNRSLQASEKIREIVMDLIREKMVALDHPNASPQQDLITSLLSLRNDHNSVALSDEEIVDNAVIKQEETSKNKASNELLTWDDLRRMKYTWRVAMESLRMNPPAFCSFRKVLKDFNYEGYLIPKGWQVMWCMTHMDDSIFPYPSDFDPKHFERQSSIPPYSFMGFGGGPPICPGYEFARLETLITVHYLVNRFTWKLCCPEISFSRDPMPSFKDGLEIEIEPKILGEII
ncbi:cytochrome P450 716B1 [Populus alba]|uniref:cytochrome P450 716B1 n=1 Tax=Populus alba TaxID=43335 RepID=UPI00158D2DE2|nr:cytochrome P450 716B1-like [Populus alba]